MNTSNLIYENRIGTTFEIYKTEKVSAIVIEISNISFMIEKKELIGFKKSIAKIIDYHKDCSCPKNIKNKTIIYQADETEIKMKLSFEELYLFKDLIKGTKFKLEMDNMLSNFRIN